MQLVDREVRVGGGLAGRPPHLDLDRGGPGTESEVGAGGGRAKEMGALTDFADGGTTRERRGDLRAERDRPVLYLLPI